jgi:O-antigen ligase
LIPSLSFVSRLLLPSNTDGLARLLLFLFPLFAVSLRHWASLIFLLLVVLGIFTLKTSLVRVNLRKLEIWLLALLALFFIAYLTSSVINGWDDRDARLLERELRFLLFIPVYLLIRRLPNALDSLGFGAVLAVFLTAFLAPIQVFYLGYGRDIGVYGPLFTGPITVLFFITGLAWLHLRAANQYRRLLIALLNVAVIVVAVLCSRSATLGAIFVILVYYVWVARNLRDLLVLGFFALVLVIGNETRAISPTASFGVALAEAKAYLDFQLKHSAEQNPYAESAVGVRLEMLRSVQYFVRDFPLWGVGGYGYQQAVSDYARQGLVSAATATHAHPHNVFAQVLVSKGMVGLAVFGAILGVCGLLLKHKRRKSSDSTITTLGFIFLLVLIFMNLTESAMVLKGNYIACMLVLLGVFVAASQQNSLDPGLDQPT